MAVNLSASGWQDHRVETHGEIWDSRQCRVVQLGGKKWGDMDTKWEEGWTELWINRRIVFRDED